MEGTMAEIRLFAPNFAPKFWSFCEGQTLAISSNTALFSLIGTIYGGDGRTTFKLPDFRSRVPVGAGPSNTGITAYTMGEVSGTATVTATVANLPAHIHSGMLNYALPAYSDEGDTAIPTGAGLASASGLFSTNPPNTSLHPADAHITIGNKGGGAPFSIMQPYLSINYIICVQGIFPSRN
ncbi:tail fiber protein [Flavobacterium sp. ST-75]|uniref:Tail fiber protein n=1 Tax=Flavobacterium rhizophilum TaxID=3163296 RepID=A0ABW8Y7U8_9FLAO